MGKFKTAYVTTNTGHDFSALLEIAEKIVFCTSGYEKEEELSDAIVKTLKDFDGAMDVIVPVGNVVANLILGNILAKRWFRIAIFQDKKYHTMEIYND
jgi:hypothetical protein